MAATFVVETGSGSSTANAYCTEAEADQYHENYGNPSAWSALSSAAKQEAIRYATRYMDAAYAARWKGIRTNRTQRLDWPRYDVEVAAGFYLEPDEMPTQLKEACAALALEHINATDGLLPNLDADAGVVKRTRSKIGSLEDETEYIGGTREAPAFPIVDGILATLLLGGGGVGVIRRG